MPSSFDQQLLDNEELHFGIVNRCIGSLQLSPISFPQTIGILISLASAIIVYLSFGIEVAVCVFLVMFLTFVGMAGKDFGLVQEKATKTRTFYSETPIKSVGEDGLPIALFKDEKSIMAGPEKDKRVWSIEREFEHLRFYGSYEAGRANAGFYTLQYEGGAKCYFVYGLKVEGFSPCMTHVDCMTAMRKLKKGFKSFPGLKLKFIWDLPADASSQILQQKQLLELADQDELTVELAQARRRWAVEKEREGEIVAPTLRVYARARVMMGQEESIAQDWKDEFGKVLATIYNRFFSESTPLSLANQAMGLGYQAACLTCMRVFNDGMGLRANPMSVHELYRFDYDQIHSEPVDRCPQYVRVTDKGMTECQEMVRTKEGNQPLVGHHILGELFKSEGVSSAPVFYREDMWLPLKGRSDDQGNPKGKFAACVRVTQLEGYASINNSHAIGHVQNVYRWLQGQSDVQLITEIEALNPIKKKDKLDKGITNRTKRTAIAIRKETQDVDSMEDIEDLVEARRLLRAGEQTLSTATFVWVYADSRPKLKARVTSVMGAIGLPSCELIQDCIEHRWFDSQPYAWEAMSTKPILRRPEYMITQGIPVLPLTQPQALDKKGLGYVGTQIPAMYFIDYCGRKNHTLITAKSGGGKSMQAAEIVAQCIATRTPGIMLDSPPLADQSTDKVAPSTYTPIIELWQSKGVNCAYQDIKKSPFNIISRCGFGTNKFEVDALVEAHTDILYGAVVGDDPHHRLKETLVNILSLSYRDFLNNTSSLTEHREPIIEDYLRHFISWGRRYESGELNLAEIAGLQGIESFDITTQEVEAIGLIRSQLVGILAQPWGKRINAQTSFDTDILFLVLGLTDVRAGSKEGLVYGLAAAAFMDRMMSKYDRSFIGMDEGSTLLPMDAFAFKFSKIFPEGRKRGANGVLLMTELRTLFESDHCGRILDNFDNILVGYSESTSVDRFVELLGFKEEILRKYTEKPNLQTMSSQWYLKRGDLHLELLYYTTSMLLGLAATSPDELKVKRQLIERSQGMDLLDFYKNFGVDLFSAYSKGRNPYSLLR